MPAEDIPQCPAYYTRSLPGIQEENSKGAGSGDFYEKTYKSSQAHLDLPGHYQQDRGILLASPQLCELSLTLTDGWLAVIVGDLFLMAQVLKLLITKLFQIWSICCNYIPKEEHLDGSIPIRHIGGCYGYGMGQSHRINYDAAYDARHFFPAS